MTRETVRVPLSDRSYDIHIGGGLIDEAGALLKPHLKRPHVFVVTDENVFVTQGERLRSSLEAAGIGAAFITLPPGEATKSFSQLEKLTGRLLDLGVERDDVVIAFGGGVIGDLTGFASSVLRRGCRFAQIPTTLLAQVDSAVGGKTAINVPQGKNLIGAFHQPDLVIADITTLDTLPPRELRAGYAEVVKYGLISDAEFFHWLEDNGPALLKGDSAARVYAVKKSCDAKAAIVGADEREKGKRALLNLGHTFGHAFEAYFGYSEKLLHGEGVALGMALAFDYSAREGLCPAEAAARVKAHLKAAGLPAEIGDLKTSPSADVIAKYMMQDKKVEQGKLTLILAKGIGESFIAKDADLSRVTAFLKEKTGE
ncbi:3-dehydroquinate synthase [Hyphococcus sp.]|uniref:3-dehydroquinate synthase n=1 Tax=Hyphococcus sp. TaxID=2038636 RepID=UPI003D0A4612